MFALIFMAAAASGSGAISFPHTIGTSCQEAFDLEKRRRGVLVSKIANPISGDTLFRGRYAQRSAEAFYECKNGKVESHLITLVFLESEPARAFFDAQVEAWDAAFDKNCRLFSRRGGPIRRFLPIPPQMQGNTMQIWRTPNATSVSVTLEFDARAGGWTVSLMASADDDSCRA